MIEFLGWRSFRARKYLSAWNDSRLPENWQAKETNNFHLFDKTYGKAVYKFSYLTFSNFQDGFNSKRLRDAHLKQHERPFKCEDDNCHYSVIGFSTNATLAHHTRLFHQALTDQIIFPRIDRCPIDRALNDAIDKEDITTVRTLAIEQLDLENASTGFIIRAIKGNKIECALILMEILGAEKDINHQDDTGGIALHMLVENQDEELITAILATKINVNTRDQFSLTALRTVISVSSVPIVTLLLRHRHGKSALMLNK